jgi:DNA-binding transcriptional LysR family regulator
MFKLPGRAGQPLPYLGYAPGRTWGRVADLSSSRRHVAIHLDRVYETDMAEGLKVMAQEGHGVAFLPHSAVKKELRSRRLVSAAPPDMTGLEMSMTCASYREKPVGKECPRAQAQALWALPGVPHRRE